MNCKFIKTKRFRRSLVVTLEDEDNHFVEDEDKDGHCVYNFYKRTFHHFNLAYRILIMMALE